MRCPLLIQFSLPELGWTIESCTGHDRPYSPSIHELRSFCTSGETSGCPIFLKRRQAAPDSPEPLTGIAATA